MQGGMAEFKSKDLEPGKLLEQLPLQGGSLKTKGAAGPGILRWGAPTSQGSRGSAHYTLWTEMGRPLDLGPDAQPVGQCCPH